MMINTPICDFVRSYAEKNPVRAHMPAHKGNPPFAESPFPEAYLYDITEVKGADALFEAEGIIGESERICSSLFNTRETVYSTAGSTACIQAMLLTAVGRGGRVIAGRNAHTAFLHTCALLDIDVKWIYPDDNSYASGVISPEAVGAALSEYKADAVYITSPDYYGHLSDIGAVSEICRGYGAYLLVDNAHGAYTAFLKENIHPTALGADMCCDSAHKTLPVLTGGAYLHTMDPALVGKAKRNMAVFCSTSPSYLILQSLDICNRYIAENIRSDLEETVSRIEWAKKVLSPAYRILETEPLKLTVDSAYSGIDGRELAGVLRENGAEPEFADSSHVVLMLSPFNSYEDIEYIADTLLRVKMPRIIMEDTPKMPALEKAVSVREAFFSENEVIPMENAAGRICSRPVYVCPPCVPAAVPGEIITREAAEIMSLAGTKKICVIKEKL